MSPRKYSFPYNKILSRWKNHYLHHQQTDLCFSLLYRRNMRDWTAKISFWWRRSVCDWLLLAGKNQKWVAANQRISVQLRHQYGIFRVYSQPANLTNASVYLTCSNFDRILKNTRKNLSCNGDRWDTEGEKQLFSHDKWFTTSKRQNLTPARTNHVTVYVKNYYQSTGTPKITVYLGSKEGDDQIRKEAIMV